MLIPVYRGPLRRMLGGIDPHSPIRRTRRANNEIGGCGV
jgi:hypothetical protein